MFLDGGLRNDEGSAFEMNRARVRLDLPLGNRTIFYLITCNLVTQGRSEVFFIFGS